jgi:hypothetical protein
MASGPSKLKTAEASLRQATQSKNEATPDGFCLIKRSYCTRRPSGDVSWAHFHQFRLTYSGH